MKRDAYRTQRIAALRKRKAFQRRLADRYAYFAVKRMLTLVASVVKTRLDLADRFYKKSQQGRNIEDRLVYWAAKEELTRLNDSLHYYFRQYPEVTTKEALDLIKRGGK